MGGTRRFLTSIEGHGRNPSQCPDPRSRSFSSGEASGIGVPEPLNLPFSLLLVDSITAVTAQDAGAVVVSASHGGVSSAGFALAQPLSAVFFNDAGVGKDAAGIAALDMLESAGVIAATIDHMSGRIGDVEDMWAHGRLSHVNALGLEAQICPGMPLQVAVRQLAIGWC